MPITFRPVSSSESLNEARRFRLIHAHLTISLPFCVYELCNPFDGNRFYVGQTNDPNWRYTQHLTGDCYTTRDIVDGFVELGHEPVMRVLVECEFRADARALEHEFIWRSVDVGMPLCNQQLRTRPVQPIIPSPSVVFRESFPNLYVAKPWATLVAGSEDAALGRLTLRPGC
jgi:hypothetical protein